MFGSNGKYLRDLATRLDAACPAWDARIVAFGPEQAVVVNASDVTRYVYTVANGQWAFMAVLTDDDGNGHQLGPVQPVGAAARDTETAARRIIETAVVAYRNALTIPDDDPFVFMRTAARLYLPLLTAGGR